MRSIEIKILLYTMYKNSVLYSMAQCLEGRLSPTLGQILIPVAVCLFICLLFLANIKLEAKKIDRNLLCKHCTYPL